MESASSFLVNIVCLGVVQGKGIRPAVARQAYRLGLIGGVFNQGAELVIQLALASPPEKDASLVSLMAFLSGHLQVEQNRIQVRLLAQAEQVLNPDCVAAMARREFVIAASQPFAEARLGLTLPVDVGLCAACRQEVMDPDHARYGYLLNSCAQCGPRYSSLQAMPYDRGNTAMAAFRRCTDCETAYHDWQDRRCHGQMIACPQCGPHYWLEDAQGRQITADAEQLITRLTHCLQQGGVVALKGVGGFHLCCDATNADAVARIRRIKGRPVKPFAVMGLLDQLAPYVAPDDVAEALLQSEARPIVLLPALQPGALAGVAPQVSNLGVFLPYTSFHQVLLQRLSGPVVMTSANRSGNPLITDHNDMASLQSELDLVAYHNRTINQGVDDSVVCYGQAQDAPQVVRLGRGLAPVCYGISDSDPPRVLAMGAELKNSLAYGENGQIALSPYVGDLYHARVYAHYQQFVQRWVELLQARPEVVAVDQHPDYHSTQWGRYLSQQQQLPLVEVQHHHAHAVATAVEHRLDLAQQRFAIVMDGFGWGDDQSLWGGEILCFDQRGYQRLSHLKNFRVLGGGQAAKQPWRNGLALSASLAAADRGYLQAKLYCPTEKRPLMDAAKRLLRGANSLATSSVGRLFDGVAALLGFPHFEISDEAQAAIWLQQLAEGYVEAHKAVDGRDMASLAAQSAAPNCVDPAPFIDYLARNRQQTPASLAYDFHQWLAGAFSTKLNAVCREFPQVNQVVLSGGCMQNALLLRLLSERLEQGGFQVFAPAKVPGNDNGIALGQAAIASAWLRSS